MEMCRHRRVIIFLISFVFITALLASPALSVGAKLYCLEDGQTIRFSECNQDIPDFICDSTTCQICAIEIRQGVFCHENINSCTGSCVDYEDPEEEDLNEITLLNPGELSIREEEGKIDFQYKVKRAYEVGFCELILNDESVMTSTGLIRAGTNILSYFVETGPYVWSIECTTRNGLDVIVSESRVLSVGDFEIEEETNPVGNGSFDIDLISPANGFSAAGQQDIIFTYGFSDNVVLDDLVECDFNFDSESTSIDVNSIKSSTSDEFSLVKSVAVGTHNWNVKCTNVVSEDLSSETRTLVINAASQSGSSSDSGGGGGGGGGSSSGGSSSSGGGGSSRGSSVGSGSSTNTGNLVLEEETLGSKTDLSEENQESSAITGAVIGEGEEKPIFPIVAAALILLAGIFVTYQKVKMKSSNQPDTNDFA